MSETTAYCAPCDQTFETALDLIAHVRSHSQAQVQASVEMLAESE